MQKVQFITLLLAVGCLPTVATAQIAAVEDERDNMYIVDPVKGTTVAITWQNVGADSSRGHTWGPDGKLYVSMWTLNGISVLDTATKVWTTLVNDPVNRIMGAAVQPVFNLDHIGGPGLFCWDTNSPPSPFPSGNQVYTNYFTVDVNKKTFLLDAVVTPTHWNDWRSDLYRNPHKAGEFIQVGHAKQEVIPVKITGVPTAVTGLLPPIVTLPHHGNYDSLIHEDQKLYVWSANTSFVGFQVVDLVAKTVTLLPVTGTSATGEAAVWEDPPENPGRIAYVIDRPSGACWRVDLLTGVATTVALTPPMPATTGGRTGRSQQEAQLLSWKTGKNKTERNFHINFGPSVGVGALYVLYPSVPALGGGYSPVAIPIPGGLELWVTPDAFSFLALANSLPGTQNNTVGLLSASGEADVLFDIGIQLGIDVVWQAGLLKGGGAADLSNTIRVNL